MHATKYLLPPRRLNWLGLLGVIITLSVVAVELLGNATLWIYSKDEAMTALLSGFARNSLSLSNTFSNSLVHSVYDYPSPLVSMLLIVLDFIPLLFSACISLLIGIFFLRFSVGEILNYRNARSLMAAGVLCIAFPAVYPIVETLEGLALSIDLPAGQGIFHFSIGFSSSAAYEIIKGVLLCTISSVIHDMLHANKGQVS